ncbi:hypothetical protein H9L10_11515 [Phycicoccus endophyticus]|uniref:ABC transporter permease n=1 Tax=Phycicoccus endophyticus TaxID=1690220 RepID=A0A7G9QZX2_9MICO|nr:hypothetical protein [Phycicoccus endophyticus]NHI20751.1 hypothetical protein [Phycicoccus endophyticus]QNN48897.1 hypothetical protein H9L10_11515 [Phycicoccus endophyticus]GGL43645.1 membrane protein [Phycicoccus endophyticus]
MTEPAVPSRLTGARLAGMLATQVLVGVVVATAFVGLYVGLQRDPRPHGLPVAVSGASLGEVAGHAAPDGVVVHVYASAEEARRAVRAHEAVAALTPASAPGSLELSVAGADGRSAVGAATASAEVLARVSGQRLSGSIDLVPLVEHDQQGLVGFYIVFGVTLASFVLAQVMVSVGALVRLRWRVLTLLVGAVASAVAVAVLAGPVFGATPASGPVLVGVLVLLATAVSLSTLAVAALVGPMGNVLATLVFTTLGNATSGATVSAYLMPALVAAVGRALPPGAAFRALVDAGYYGRDGMSRELVVLAAWALAAGGLLLLHHRPRAAGNRRTLDVPA